MCINVSNSHWRTVGHFEYWINKQKNQWSTPERNEKHQEREKDPCLLHESALSSSSY